MERLILDQTGTMWQLHEGFRRSISELEGGHRGWDSSAHPSNPLPPQPLLGVKVISTLALSDPRRTATGS
jgi:hypothetical protein